MQRDADEAMCNGWPDQHQRVAAKVRELSHRKYLLLGILIPVAMLVSVHIIRLYGQARIVQDSTHAALTPSDSGPGINTELAQRLYQLFPQVMVRAAWVWGWRFAKKLCRCWAAQLP